MKNILIVVFVLAFIPNLTFGQKEVKKELNKLITEWHNAAADVDQKSYFDFIDDDGIYIGTDSTEIWTKQEFFDWSTPHFSKKKTWSFKANDRNIYLSEDKQFAWFDEVVDFGGGTLRGSGILINSGSRWRIVHYVLSVPVPNEKFKDVMGVINNEQEDTKIEK